MTCDKCAAREKAEARERESCNQERERLDTQSKRLTIMLTVLSTLVGKEILDKAAGIFDVVGEVSSLTDSSFGGEDYSTSFASVTRQPDVPDVADVAGGRGTDPDILSPWAVPPLPGSYLPGFYKPTPLYLFAGSQTASVVPESPGLFLALLALKPRRKR